MLLDCELCERGGLRPQYDLHADRRAVLSALVRARHLHGLGAVLPQHGQLDGRRDLGAVLTATLAPALALPAVQAMVRDMPASTQKAGADPALGPVNALFDLTIRDTIAPQTRAVLAGALEGSLWWVFFAMALLAVLSALMVTRFPRVVHRVDDVAERHLETPAAM